MASHLASFSQVLLSACDIEKGPERMIENYEDFCKALLEAGFSVFGGNHEGVFGLIPFDWKEEPADSPIRWHTDDPDTDPWAWRIRVLDEGLDIAYAKVFFRKGGYITKEWYPYFLAARREGFSFEDAYFDGAVSAVAKRIYETVSGHGSLPLDEIKRLAGFSREEKSKFDRALTELQMKLYLTICGAHQRLTQMGLPYGMASTTFCTTEQFWGEDVFRQAEGIHKPDAVQAIRERVFALNPAADEKQVLKFILG